MLRASSSETNSAMRLAVDIGGTFTDVVLMDPQGDIVASAKVLTSHANPATAALEGTHQALEAAAVGLADIESLSLIHI